MVQNKATVTLLCPGVWNRTLNLLNISPVNAKLTSPSYVHQYIFRSSATYSVAIITPTTFVSVLFFPLIVQLLSSSFHNYAV